MAWNWAGAGAGSLGGAASGATLGSFGGPIGTGIGGGIGALLGLLGGGLSSKQSPWGQSPNKLSPEKQKMKDDLIQQTYAASQNPSAGFEPFANQARQQFNTQTVPGLAERFTSLGSGGSQRSSAFSGSIGAAGAGLESQLAYLQGQYGLQNRDSLMSMLTPDNEQTYMGEQPDFGQSLLQTGGNIAGSYLAGGGDFGFGGKAETTALTPAAKASNFQSSIKDLKPAQKMQLIKFIQGFLKK